MKHFSLFLLSLVFITSCKKELVDTTTNKLEDVTSFSSFDTKVKSGVSLMFFHANWCSKCKAQRPAIDAVLEKSSFSKVFFGEVNYETNKETVDKYNVDGFPTIIIFKDNQVKHTLSGSGHTQKEIEDLLSKLL